MKSTFFYFVPIVGLALSAVSVAHAEVLELEIRTAIEEPACQSGMKSTHTITTNINSRDVEDEQILTGKTNILGCDFGSINDRFKTVGHYRTKDSIKFTVVGSTATIATLGLGASIDYEFVVEINFKDRTLTFSGKHDGYPTYYVEVNGNGAYKFNQTNLTKLAEPMDISVEPQTISF